jgi:hypothetical protein
MDRIAQRANQSRSMRGGTFEIKINRMLSKMLKDNKIKGFKRKPKIYGGEFNPDFVVEKNNGKIISIDATTTARTDRLRAKQWDAYGTKKYFSEKGKTVKAVVVVDEINTSRREKDNFRLCKARCKLPYSALDDTVSVKELKDLLKS